MYCNIYIGNYRFTKPTKLFITVWLFFIFNDSLRAQNELKIENFTCQVVRYDSIDIKLLVSYIEHNLNAQNR